MLVTIEGNEILLDPMSPTVSSEEIYLCAKTSNGRKNSRKVMYDVCGLETITLTEQEVSVEYSQMAGNTTLIEAIDISEKFTTSNPNC